MSDAARIEVLERETGLLKARLDNALDEADELRDEVERRIDEAEGYRRALAEVTAERDRLKGELVQAKSRIAKLEEEVSDFEAVMDEVASESAYAADLDGWEVEP